MGDEPGTVASGKTIKTSSGSEVFVGHAEKYGDCTLIRFIGPDGHQTHIRLSKEAAVALRDLLVIDQDDRERDLIWQVRTLVDEFARTASSEPPTSSV